MKEPGIASVAANRLDRELPLVGDGQREEVARLGEGFGDQVLIDTVVDNLEEAHVAAHPVHLRREPCQRTSASFSGSSEIDNGKCHRDRFLRSIVSRSALKNGMSAN